MTTTRIGPERLWFGPHGPVVMGIFALAFLTAFEALAVATVMPEVATQLDGLELYALAFAAPIAVGVVSMTVAGPEIDRNGPRRALRIGVAVFALGLVVAGLAGTMPIFLVGRVVQGLGAGLISVALYVVIGQTFPEHLRARVFTVLTGAWLLPALIGPVVAGFVADTVGWRWVFLGVPGLAVLALGLMWSVLDTIGGDRVVQADHRRARWSVLIAAGVLGVSMAGQRTYAWWPVLLVTGLWLVVAYTPRLLPPGAWRATRGLPSVIAVRGLLSAGYFGVEAYVPLSLVEHRGLTVTQAGLFLTTAAVLWFTGSWLAAHVRALDSKPLRVRLGAMGVLVAIGSAYLTLTPEVPIVMVAVLWSIGGLGMGMAAPTLGVLLLDHSEPQEQGANSAAMQTNDAVTQSLMLAVGSAVFALMLSFDATIGYVMVFSLAAFSAMGAVVLASRVAVPSPPRSPV